MKKKGKIFGKKYYIGNKEIDYDGKYIIIDGKRYTSTDGLWELITSKNLDKNMYDINDHITYDRATDVIYVGNNPNNPYPKSSRGQKWKELVGPLWNSIQKEKYEGSGVVIPCDPNALIERLDLLFASKAAGNTGVRNELVSICDELKRQGVINSNSYKRLISIL